MVRFPIDQTTLDRHLAHMTIEYDNWQREQRLPFKLGSADEHIFDDRLTQAQQDWMRSFSFRWEAVCRGEFENAFPGTAKPKCVLEAEHMNNILRDCLGLMEGVVEPCDHDVGICWCEWHNTMDRAYRAIRKDQPRSMRSECTRKLCSN